MDDDDWKWNAPLCDVDAQADRVPELLAELRILRDENERLRELRSPQGSLPEAIERLRELVARLHPEDGGPTSSDNYQIRSAMAQVIRVMEEVSRE